MMTTNRRARKAQSKIKISPHAVELFKQMRSLPDCTCTFEPFSHPGHVGTPVLHRNECASCRQWWDWQNELHDELGLSVGDYPAVDHPPSAPEWDENRSLKHAGGPEGWDKGGKVFNALMVAAYGEEAATP